jgi:hypothetical protein
VLTPAKAAPAKAAPAQAAPSALPFTGADTAALLALAVVLLLLGAAAQRTGRRTSGTADLA